MSPITQALANGYTIQQVLKYLTNTFPALAPKIQTAQRAGYSANQIIDFVSSTMEGGPPNRRLSQSEIHGQNAEKQGQMTKNMVKAGAGALGAAALSQSGILGSLFGGATQGQGQQPNQPQQPPVRPNVPRGTQQGINPTPSPMQQTPGQTIGAQVHAPGNTQPSVPVQSPSPQQPIQPQVDSKSIIQQMGLEDQIKTMQQAGNPPEQIGQAIEVMAKPEQKKWLQSQTSQPLSQIVNDYLSQNKAVEVPNNAVEPPKIAVEAPKIAENVQKEPKKTEEFPKIEPNKATKGESVVTDDGEVGDIESISGRNALVKVNGKLKQVPIESLKGQPATIRESKIVIDPSKVPESEKSAALGYVMKTPNKKAALIKWGPGKGGFYLYLRKDGKEISEDVFKKLQEGMTLPLTSKDTFMGTYDTSTADSRGTVAVSELRNLAQNVEDEEDPTKEYYFTKFDEVFTHGLREEYEKALMEFTKAYSHVEKTKKSKK